MARAPNNQLPNPPVDPEDWIGMRNLLVEMRERVLSLSKDSTPPAVVTGLTLTQVYPGIYIQWNPALKADKYSIYRNTTSDFDTATVTAQLRDTSFFDQTQSLGATTLYYWILPLNDLGIPGPVSAMSSTANSSPPMPGTIPNPVQGGYGSQNNQAVFQLADFDEIGDALAIATTTDSSNDATLWAYIEGDNNYWATGDYRGFSIP